MSATLLLARLEHAPAVMAPAPGKEKIRIVALPVRAAAARLGGPRMAEPTADPRAEADGIPEARLRFVMDAITFYPSFRPWELDYLGTRPAP